MEKNRMLGALQGAETQAFGSKLQLVDMPVGMVVCESGIPMPYAYFPTSSVVSLLHSTERGNTSQIALVGNEGLVGVSAFMGGNSTSDAVVISAGMGYRMGRKALLHAFDDHSKVQKLLLRYTQALIAQVSQNAVCNRHHHVDQQLCSLLLLCGDRFPSDVMLLTHEQLADMLGVRRERVTHVAFQLQDAGLIRYARGRIQLLDHQALEGRACECYALVKAECARLVSMDAAPPPSDPAVLPAC